MTTAITTIGLAFIEGLALSLSPCILPVLPLILGASLGGTKQKPFGIILGFVLSFTVFALISRETILAFSINPEIIRNISLFLLVTFGVVMVFPKLSNYWSSKSDTLGHTGHKLISYVKGDGFYSGLSIGALIGIVWAPCAGPILAAAIIQIIQADSNIAAITTIAAFSLGAGIPMLIIATSGNNIMKHLGFLKKNSYTIRRVFGIIMIAGALSILTGLNIKIINWTAETAAQTNITTELENALATPLQAPEITGITDWINSNPLTLKDLRGKVVLIDFWTYSCINCIRTLPYVTKWYNQYKNDGLVVIGIHAPEFAFERQLENVRDAVREHHINYPVALDNNARTWAAYNNKYWPAHYLIDRDGQIVYTHFGEGNYAITENNIRVLLGQKKAADQKQTTFNTDQSPETYLGFARSKNFASPEKSNTDTPTQFTFPKELSTNQWALDGNWTVEKKNITSNTKGARLRYNFKAKKVHLVMGTTNAKPVNITVTIDAQPPSTLTINKEKLYTIANTNEGAGIITITAEQPGLKAYAFTFGE
jgi:cytochrome c biogenesis protein CcdA/thiol-disulfide isomerase/thioredoxin